MGVNSGFKGLNSFVPALFFGAKPWDASCFFFILFIYLFIYLFFF